MQHIFDKAPCLYFATAEDGTIVDVNERLCTMLQYDREELAGKKVEMLFTIATKIFHQTHFYPLLKIQGNAYEIYITLQRKDGEHIPVLVNAERKEVDGKTLNLYAGIIVQNRKKFEDELIAARRNAEDALNENTVLTEAKYQLQVHMEELDRQVALAQKQNDELHQFSRVVTHDMQEPLRKLALFSSYFMEVQDEQEQHKLVERMRGVLEQMRQIMSGLQQYVWLNDAKMLVEDLDLYDILSVVVKRVEEENPDVFLEIDVECDEKISGDREQVELLFYHILSNAVRFRRGEKAEVSITLHKVQRNQFQHLEGRYKYIDHIMITVTDSGIGFDPVYKNKLFALFRRLHPGSGRGTGLAICKKITERHSGTILIDSTLNGGTTVTVYLPCINVPGSLSSAAHQLNHGTGKQ